MGTQSNHPDDLLPWYINGTLDGEELNKVKTHLESCSKCQSEVSYLKVLRSQVKEVGKVALPGALGLNRLLREIRKEAPSRKRFSRWWQPSLAIAAALIIVIQGIVVYNYSKQVKPIAPLSGPVAEGVVLQVRFSPDASEREIRQALQEVEGSLIDGPGALGIYRVRLDLADGQEGRIQQRIERLKQQKNVVTHVSRE